MTLLIIYSIIAILLLIFGIISEVLYDSSDFILFGIATVIIASIGWPVILVIMIIEGIRNIYEFLYRKCK